MSVRSYLTLVVLALVILLLALALGDFPKPVAYVLGTGYILGTLVSGIAYLVVEDRRQTKIATQRHLDQQARLAGLGW